MRYSEVVPISVLVRDRLVQEPEEEGKHWRFTGVLYDYIRSCSLFTHHSVCFMHVLIENFLVFQLLQ